MQAMKNASMLKLRPIFTSLIILTAGQALPSYANDFERQDGVRGETYCFPAKHAVKTMAQLATINPEDKDVVEIVVSPRFLIYDGGNLPDRYYLKTPPNTKFVKTDAELIAAPLGTVDFTILPDGSVPDFVEKIELSSAKSDICIDDKARIGLSEDDESLYFEMGLTPYFKNKSGHHDIAELKRGIKDGKTQYKKMVPGALRAFMPDTDYLHIKYEDTSTPSLVTAYIGDTTFDIHTDFYNQGHVFSAKDLIAQKVDRIEIKGGGYKLSPVPSIKTMKRFGIGKPRGPQKPVQAIAQHAPEAG